MGIKEVAYPLEVIGDLKFTLLLGQVGLDFSVSVVDDGQEHVDQNEEDEEHVGDEEDRPKEPICVFNLFEVEVTKDDAEQGEAAKGNR